MALANEVGVEQSRGSKFVFLAVVLRNLLSSQSQQKLAHGLEKFRKICETQLRSTEDTEFSIPFPGVPDNPDAAMEQGYLIMSSADVGRLFEPIIQEIIALIEQQMRKVRAKGKQVAGIVLVGGFGQASGTVCRRCNNATRVFCAAKTKVRGPAFKLCNHPTHGRLSSEVLFCAV